jgi:hypothetical protein
MNTHYEERMKKLLRQSLPPVKGDAGPERDLWPAMLRRLDAGTTARALSGWAWLNGAWFDGALLAGLVGLIASFPTAIPVFLYYL